MTEPVPIILTVQVGERKETRTKVIRSENPLPVICAFIQEFAAMIIRVYLCHRDDLLQAAIPKGLKNVGTEWRTFISDFGKIRFSRRVYKEPSGKRIKPLDDVLGLASYARRTQDEEIRTCVLAAKSNYRYAAQIESLITHAGISPSTVSRIVKKVGGNIAETDQNFFPKDPGSISAPILYAESDGTFVRLQKEQRKHLEIRSAIAYTGKKYTSKGRYRLENKVTLTAADIPNLQWQEMLRNHLYASFDLSKVKLLAFGGDGASWVRQSFDLLCLPRKEFVLDPFHVHKAVREAYTGKVNISDLIFRLHTQGFDSVEKMLLPFNAPSRSKASAVCRQCFNYLKNNQDALLSLSCRDLPFSDLRSLGCMESSIGKTLALRMKTRGCSWSVAGAAAMASILTHLPELEKNSSPIVTSGLASQPYFSLFKNIMFDQ